MSDENENESEVEPVRGFFNDHKWGADVIKAGANFLKKNWANSSNSEFKLIERVRVVFDKEVESEEYENNFGNNTVIVHAPIIENESKKEQQERHRFLVKYYGNGIQEAHIGAVMKFLSLLTPGAHKNLVDEYKSSIGNNKE
jgi:hypothetical protein